MTVVYLIVKTRENTPTALKNKTAVFFFILLGANLNFLNFGAGFSITSDLEKQFSTDSTTASWVISGYALTVGSFVILFGKLGDIIGLHIIFVAGLAIITVLSLINALIRKEIIALITFRALQGIGGAAILPSAIALTGNYFTGKALNLAINGLLLAFTASMGIGILLGGAFSLTSIGYRSFFYFTFALGLICVIYLTLTIIPVERSEPRKNMKVKNLNFGGAAFLVAGLILIIYGFTTAGLQWSTPKVYVTIPIGVVVVLAVVLFEGLYIGPYKHKHSATKNWKTDIELLFPPQILTIPNFIPFACGLFCTYAAFTGLQNILVQYFEFVQGNSSLMAAVKLLPLTVGLIFGSVVYRPIMAEKIGTRNILVISAFFSLATTVWCSRLDQSSNSFWKYEFAPLFLYGYGTNLFYQVYYNAILSQTPKHLQGSVSGVFQTMCQIGVSIGSAITTTIIGSVSEANASQAAELSPKMRNAFYFCVGCHALEVVLMLFSTNPKPKTEDHEEKKLETEP
ncbi:hypothetical protein OGAPHI_001705 [Ogataea philodendri]|uniref:Major facilitator superfamily (MFS) profile domain-containing protein n=1 Tax=Ogataea philodendri TaxID=1378263 RepID=A0A9P8T6L7_9ASCO|nr:uncharacterized protein OGAPHI_001705 [Ogataea philodendri]KAH3667951.1 hypothetical protein OGAPHI_001705 [Ogataea philodendri]